jgi:WD40 repeat protein
MPMLLNRRPKFLELALFVVPLVILAGIPLVVKFQQERDREAKMSERKRSGNFGIRGGIFSADGRHIATASEQGDIKIWNATNGVLEMKLDGPSGWYSLSFSSDGRWLAAATGESVELFDLKAPSAKRHTRSFPGRQRCSIFSPDSKVLLTGDFVAMNTASSLNISMWRPETGTKIGTLTAGMGRLSGLAFSHDGRQLLILGETKGLGILENYDLRPKKLRWRRAGLDYTYGIVFSPDTSAVLVSGSTPMLLNANTGKPLPDWGALTSHWGSGHFAFSPDGKSVVGLVSEMSSVEACLWDRRDGQLQQFIGFSISSPGPFGFAEKHFSPDIQFLAACNEVGQLQVWRATTSDKPSQRVLDFDTLWTVDTVTGELE